MPLPWLMIFFFIFTCFFSVSLYFTFFSFDSPASLKGLKSHSDSISW